MAAGRTELPSGRVATLVLALLLLSPGLTAAIPAADNARGTGAPPNGPVLSSVAPPAAVEPFAGNCTPPAAGDWTVNVPTTCAGTSFALQGNVLVTSMLDLANATVTFTNPPTGGWILHAFAGSTLTIRDSNLTAMPATGTYTVLVDSGVVFAIERSTLAHFGAKDPELWRPYASGAEEAIYEQYIYTGPGFTSDTTITGNDGLVVRSTPVAFRDNLFRNYTVIRFFAPGSLVERNTFENMSHEGLAFLPGSDNEIVRGNVFRNATRMNREIHGLRFYPGVQNEQISNNTFSWLPSAVLVANIPPWTSGFNFEFHHNRYTQVMSGVSANMRNSRIHNETFDDIMRAISIEASRYVVVEDVLMANLTFQQKVENVINRTYYLDIKAHDLSNRILPNMAYWMWGFYCSKFFLSIGWYGDGLQIRHNTFRNAPPWSIAINTDMAQGLVRSSFTNNTFERIGTYIPAGYIVREDWTGYNALLNLTPITGASIFLEGSDSIEIAENTFLEVQHGITTSSVDALGNYGSFNVHHNLLRGVGASTWTERFYDGSWWNSNHVKTENGVGIATGMHYISGGAFNWSSLQDILYRANSTQRITNNTLFDFRFPVAVDYRRDQPSASLMGTKTAIVADNLFLNYTMLLSQVSFGNSLTFVNNEERPVFPLALGNVSVVDAHHRAATGRVHLVPLLMYIPDSAVPDIVSWDLLTAAPAGPGPPLRLATSADGGTTWDAVPAGGSLAGVPPDNRTLRIRTDLDIAPRRIAALDTDVTLAYTVNTLPSIAAIPASTGTKHVPKGLFVNASDPENDPLAYLWIQVAGPAVTLANSTTAAPRFTPPASGIYRFRVDVSDGYGAVNRTATVSVDNRPPAVVISAPPIGFKREATQLVAVPADPDGDNLTYAWSQTGGPPVLLLNASGPVAGLLAGEVGFYTIGLVVSDGEVNASAAEVTITVVGRPPVASLSAEPASVRLGDPVRVSGSGSADPDGNVTGLSFVFGDGDETGFSPVSTWEHTYDAVGEYTIELVVRDEDGNTSGSVSAVVRVLPDLHPPTVEALADPESGDVDTLFRFRSDAADDDGRVIAWTWSFGDGTTADGATSAHRYVLPGTYAASVTVRDNDGLEATGSVTVTVLPRPNGPPVLTPVSPKATDVLEVRKPVSFIVTASDPDDDPLTYSWTIDGSPAGANSSSLNMVPTKAGTIRVRVSVTDNHHGPVTHDWTQTVRGKARPVTIGTTAVVLTLVGILLALGAAVAALLLARRRRQRPSPVLPSEPTSPGPSPPRESAEPPATESPPAPAAPPDPAPVESRPEEIPPG